MLFIETPRSSRTGFERARGRGGVTSNTGPSRGESAGLAASPHQRLETLQRLPRRREPLHLRLEPSRLRLGA
jgi:hypothetical protein